MSTSMEQRWNGDGTFGDAATVITPQCQACAWQNPDRPSACRAYPDGIPAPIRLNEVDHRRPYPGDRGIRFAPKPGITHPRDDPA